ncbi:hypothetical protein F5B17DRAFT_386130 [Nemania serpens]|nr:hypothetical protein F5B17DRAFT_386130 [Nemania serpens]
METFVNSYHPDDKEVAGDTELQAWHRELMAARVYDFPRIQTRQAITDILTHQVYLSVIVSDVMGTNSV